MSVRTTLYCTDSCFSAQVRQPWVSPFLAESLKHQDFYLFVIKVEKFTNLIFCIHLTVQTFVSTSLSESLPDVEDSTSFDLGILLKQGFKTSSINI